MNYFETLNEINCNELTEKKGGLTYLSWAHAWKELKKRFPRSFYTVYQNDLEWNYFTDNRYCWVKTGVTVVTDEYEVEHIEYLPVMDYKNKPIPVDMVTSFDVNKAIQRSLTKAVARHGLGLYIYAGEDLPDKTDGGVEDRKVAESAPVLTRSELETKFVALCDAKQRDVEDFYKKAGVSGIGEISDEQLIKWINWLHKK